MDFQKEVFSKVLINEDYKEGLENIIQIIKKHQLKEVEILFGVS